VADHPVNQLGDDPLIVDGFSGDAFAAQHVLMLGC
jgi:hypothetical protein